MKVEGSCFCGSVRFEAEVDPERVSICHCTNCQELTGTAYRVSVRAQGDQFKLVSGTPKTYVKTAESGSKRAQVFCPECGSQLYAHSVDGPRNYSLRVGVLRQRRELAPRRQIWCQSAFGWTQDLSGLPRTERQ